MKIENLFTRYHCVNLTALHNTAKEELCRITKRMSTGLHEIVRTMKGNYCGVYVKGQK